MTKAQAERLRDAIRRYRQVVVQDRDLRTQAALDEIVHELERQLAEVEERAE